MKEGDIGLAALPQADGELKLRPVLLLKHLPAFGDFVVCGISTQLRHEQKGMDEILVPDATNRLKQPSLIRLTYLHTVSANILQGTIGQIPLETHGELLRRLARFFSGKV